ARLFGPCYRCLGDAILELPIRTREYQDENPQDEEMRTEYVEGNMLDVSAWARDAIALALPEKILCRPDCAGLCDVCGKNLNDEPEPAGRVQRDRRLVRGEDPGLDRPDLGGVRLLAEPLQQRPADPPAARLARDVDRVLGNTPVAGALGVRRERRPAEHLAVS